MATVTTGGSGNWSSTTPNAPWPGGTLPNATDDVIVATGHTLTVDGNYTIGSSPDNITTYAIDCAGTGMLTINTACTLTVKGNVRFNGGTSVRLTINGTGKLYFDTSARTSSPKLYRILAGTAGEWTCYMRGTDKDNLATIEADSGGYFYQTYTAGGTLRSLLDIQYGKWVRCWDGVTGISVGGWACNRGATGAIATIDYLIMDTCGTLALTDTGADRTASIDRVFANDPPANAGNYGIKTSGFGASNVATIRRSVMRRNPNSMSHEGTDMQESGYHGPDSMSGGSAYLGSNTRWNFITVDQADGNGPGIIVSAAQNTSGSAKDQISFARGTGANVHWTAAASSTAGLTITENGRIYCSASGSINGDCWIPALTGAGSTSILNNALFASISNGNQPGSWCSLLGNANQNIEVEHNTGVMSDGAPRGIVTGEGYAGHAGMVAKLRYNLCIDGLTTPATTRMLFYQDTTTTGQKMNAANAGDNWFDSAAVNTDAEGYDLSGTQTTPAIASLYAASGQIDPYRTIADWAAWWGARIGAAGDGSTTPNADATYLNAHLLLTKAYELELYTGSAMVQIAHQYIRRGYIPTATAGRGAGADGLTPGMFGAWAPAVTTPTVAGSTASCTTNCTDGTAYWVITQSATAPDWDRVLTGKDHTGATVAAGFSGNQAVSTTSIAIDISGASLGGGNYYIHVAHRAAGSEAALDDYLRTSEPVTSAAFQGAAGGGRSKLTSSILRSITGSLLQAA